MSNHLNPSPDQENTYVIPPGVESEESPLANATMAGAVASKFALNTVPNPATLPKFPRLSRHDSPYKTPDSSTVHAKLRVASVDPEKSMAEIDEQLITDFQRIKEFTIFRTFQYSYTPEELRGLIGVLNPIAERDRTSLLDIQHYIIDTYNSLQKDLKTNASLNRYKSGTERRKLIALSDLSAMARKVVEAKRPANAGCDHRAGDLFIDITKEPAGDQSLLEIYRCASLRYCLEIVAKRKDAIAKEAEIAFLANMGPINDWYQRTIGILEADGSISDVRKSVYQMLLDMKIAAGKKEYSRGLNIQFEIQKRVADMRY